MNNDEIFSPEEWEKLKHAFPFVFYLIAGADKKIDKKERNAIERIFKHPDSLDNKLASQLIIAIDKHFFDNVPKDLASNLMSLKEISNILDNKLEPPKSLKFKKILIAVGIYIAKASGDLFTSKMSGIEAQAINKISDSFNLSIEDLHTKPSVHKILKKLIKKLSMKI